MGELIKVDARIANMLGDKIGICDLFLSFE